MRRNKRQKNETVTPPLNPIAQDFKSAIDTSNSIPIEHVFRTNKNCRHNYGSNKYSFYYPGEWKTITNQQLILGVRAIYFLKPVKRELSFDLIYHNEFEKDKSKTYSYKDTVILNSDFTLENICDNINEWFNKLDPLPERFLEFKFFNKSMIIYCGCDSFFLRKRWIELKNLSPDFKNIFRIDDKPKSKSVGYFINEGFPVVKIIPGELTFKEMTNIEYSYGNSYQHDELEIRASFVNQTELQHLGYTGISFIPLKYYKINSTDTEFYIELLSKDGSKEIELVDDEKDCVVIEAVLTTKNLH